MNFTRLQDCLCAFLRRRIAAGEVTERQLARLTGVSQPHLHNVLKGKRAFSLSMADRILAHLRLDLLELLDPAELLQWRRRD